MKNIILTKWIEPYVLLEELKKHCEMKDYTFDGFSKKSVKEDFIKQLSKENSFGLYMKNVNKFYLFKGSVDICDLFGFQSPDCYETDNIDEPFELVDSGKAEAGFIFYHG